MIAIGPMTWMKGKALRDLCFFIEDTAVTWSSKKQPIVTLSLCEADYVATTSCICHVIWLRNLMKELHIEQEEPTRICINNMLAFALAKNPIFHDQSKHFDTRYQFIRESIVRKEIKLKYMKTYDQIADIFTKLLRYEVFLKLREALRMKKQV